jgi:NADPH-dependent 2,4-dienoyl-CoA reductase/sulfur reductase-like enzyme
VAYPAAAAAGKVARMHVVIVGNGVAGIEAALTVRRREPGCRITVVSEESEHFFSRTALMYVLSGQLTYRDIEPHDRELYQRLRLERVRARATAVDADKKELHVVGGPPLKYDRLVLACGSRPRPPPWENAGLAGVGHFVTLQDLRWLELCVHGRHGVDLPVAQDGHVPRSSPDSPYQPRTPVSGVKNPLIVGGGLIGIETVETFLAAKIKPTFLYREDWFWPIALDPNEGKFIADRLRHHGATVVHGRNPKAFVGEGRVTGLALEDGETLACDLVVVAIGVVPNTAWLANGPVNLDPSGAIAVDEHLLTSCPDVWACGDCAGVPQPEGGRRPEQLWYTARDQGRIAGRNTLGDKATYSRGTWYNSAKLMDSEYTTAGRIPGRPAPNQREWYFEETGRVRSTLRLVLDPENRVLGMNALGRRWDHTVWMRWIDERRPLAWVLDRVGEASFDTEFVPPLVIPAGHRNPPPP